MNLIDVLHVGPLFVICLILVSFALNTLWFGSKGLRFTSLSPVILLLCSIGIAAGVNAHEHMEFNLFFDPCFFYSASIILVAVSYMKETLSKVISMKS